MQQTDCKKRREMVDMWQQQEVQVKEKRWAEEFPQMVDEVQRDHQKSVYDENEERRKVKVEDVKDATKRDKPRGNLGSGSFSF